MTDEELAELEALAEEASPAPWRTYGPLVLGPEDYEMDVCDCNMGDGADYADAEEERAALADAAFIAASRTAIPSLIRALREMRASVEEMRALAIDTLEGAWKVLDVVAVHDGDDTIGSIRVHGLHGHPALYVSDAAEMERDRIGKVLDALRLSRGEP